VLGTALAQIILYRVLRSDGAARVSLVTYLLPVTALFYGVTLLGEPLTVEELVGNVADPRQRRVRLGCRADAPPRAGARHALALSVVEGDGVRLRRATPDDVDFLVELTTHEDVEPYLAGSRPRDRDGLLEEIERSQAEPEEFGRFVVEVEENGDWRRAGAMGFELANRRSRIANLGNLAIHPDFRGRRLSDDAAKLLQRHLLFELGFHRLQLEIYGFNERAQRHAERAGFVREGARRLAYWRHGEWVDGVIYGLVREDLEP
jgi:RimJ/RimL family protein N-acetyltransferase